MTDFQLVVISIMLTIPGLPGQAASDPWAPKVELLPGTPGRADLVGEWFQSRMSTVNFSNTGSFFDPSWERTNVRFLPDGTFRLGWLKQASSRIEMPRSPAVTTVIPNGITKSQCRLKLIPKTTVGTNAAPRGARVVRSDGQDEIYQRKQVRCY